MNIIEKIKRWFIKKGLEKDRIPCYVRVNSKNIKTDKIIPSLDTIKEGQSGIIIMKNGKIRNFTLLYIDKKPKDLGMDWVWYVLKVD